MKTVLTLILVMVTALMANAQPGWYAALPGDTVVLNISGQNGTIQWQQSTDSITWSNISGATTTPYELISTSSPTNKRYYRAAITDVLCPNATPYYSSIICYKTSTTLISVGDLFHGGIVFYTDGTGHGLIALQQDQSTGVQWGCYGTSITGATSLTDGNSNTAAIYNNCATRPIAASVCYDLVLNGYNDWFLPAKDQLNYLYLQRALVDGLSNNYYYYWSSSDYNANNAWLQYFHIGSQDFITKNATYYVRCVRSFLSTDNLTSTNSIATVTNQPVTASITSQPGTQNKCLGSSVTFTVVATGTTPITYQWKKDGTDISGATSNTFIKSGLTFADEGIYTCEATNLCRTVASNNAELKVIDISASAGIDTRICNGQSTTLSATASSNHSAESGNYSYSWTPTAGLSSATIYNPNASPTVTINYIVQTTDQLGCTATDEINVFVQNPFSNEQICLVTVDTVAWKNKIMWEKTTNVGTAGFNIYKEVSTNIYSGIGFVPYNDPAFLTDNSSQPEGFANRYKIAVVDTCGAESAKTFYHMTMNLTIAANGSTMGLNWSHYIDESGTFVPSLYYIYRGTSPSNMQFLASVPGTVNSYNDVNVFNVYYYMVGVEKASGCNTAKAPTYSYSNKKDNSSFIGIVEHNGYNMEALSIFPNPFKESTTIKFYNPDNKQFVMTLTDLKGRVVRKTENVIGNEIIIEKKDLMSGVYFMELKGEDRTFRGKLIIE